jgi:uncharacterized membrane protein (UPF0127 family)
MIAALLTLLLQAETLTAPPAACLPGGAGFLSMRLRGSIEAEIRWREPELECSGMPRPDGRGLRVHFAGKRADGGELSIVFAAPELGMGVSAKGVPVNVTLLDSAGERIYNSQADSRCFFDEVRQRALLNAVLPPRSYRVDARGFGTVPARAVDGEGAVLLTRFDFAGTVSFGDGVEESGPSLPPQLARLPQSELDVATGAGTHHFKVWVAADDASRERGLMHVRELAPDRGMLFLFDQPQPAAFWMKDTPVSLDILFVASDGRVVNIARKTVPFSLARIESEAPVTGVLELAAGTAERLGIAPGDQIRHPAFSQRS